TAFHAADHLFGSRNPCGSILLPKLFKPGLDGCAIESKLPYKGRECQVAFLCVASGARMNHVFRRRATTLRDRIDVIHVRIETEWPSTIWTDRLAGKPSLDNGTHAACLSRRSRGCGAKFNKAVGLTS